MNGAIVRWRVQGAKGGPFALRVLRPNGTGAYTAAGTSAPATPTGGAACRRSPRNLPVKAGDLIGVDPTNASDKIGVARSHRAPASPRSSRRRSTGRRCRRGNRSGKEIELSAEVQPAPAITSITPAPARSPVAPGENHRHRFDRRQRGQIRRQPAASFTVESETEITATAPATTKPGTVDITVTTLAGTSPPAATTASSTRLRRPEAQGNKLKAAKNRLRNAGCKIGKVKKLDGAKPKTGVVTKQNPAPKKVLAPGAKVNVTLEMEKTGK